MSGSQGLGLPLEKRVETGDLSFGRAGFRHTGSMFVLEVSSNKW